MEQQTAVEWIEHNIQSDMNFMEIMGLIRQAKAMEKEQIKDAVMYGLDEDGHTGDWKISVAQKYYNEKHLGIKGLSD
jgi:hypothetical protein